MQEEWESSAAGVSGGVAAPAAAPAPEPHVPAYAYHSAAALEVSPPTDTLPVPPLPRLNHYASKRSFYLHNLALNQKLST